MKTRVVVIASVLVEAACASKPPRPVEIPLPKPKASIEHLTAELASPDADHRAAAAWQLAGAGSVGSATGEALVKALDDPEASVRDAATWALYHVKAPNPMRLADSPPTPLRLTKPQYPQAAFSKKVEGTVILELLIDEGGRVAHSVVYTSVPGLDDAALSCARQWEFEPARRGGKPVPVMVRAPVAFRIF